MRATFSFPTKVVYGANAVEELPGRLEALGAKRPLVVTDPGLLPTAAFARVKKAVAEMGRVFADVHGNPTQQDVESATDAMLAGACDSVIAVGGGSAIDVAKVIRLRAVRRNVALSEIASGADNGKLAPFVAIPTTAGTGSEVGRSSVVTIGKTKQVIFHPSLLADLVILDPELTLDLPAKLTAATGADALTHCIESFTSTEFHPLCDAIALEGIHMIVKALPRVMKEPKDVDARGQMQIAAMMGGIAFQKELGAAHSLAHPLSAICGLHHGLANALVLPAVMRFNAARQPGLYRRVGEAMTLRDTGDANTIGAIEALLREIGISSGLAALGVREDQIKALAEQAIADGCHKTNPVPVTRDDLRELYREAM